MITFKYYLSLQDQSIFNKLKIKLIQFINK